MNQETESSRFDNLIRKLVAVPKAEVVQKEVEYKQQRKKLKKRRKPTK